jgi:hypothetical protein
MVCLWARLRVATVMLLRAKGGFGGEDSVDNIVLLWEVKGRHAILIFTQISH